MVSSVQPLSRVWLFATSWTATHQASLSITNTRSLPKLMSIESVMPSSVVPFSSRLQSFPASGFFQMSQLLVSGGQRIGALASASVLAVNVQNSFPLGWTGWISLQSKGLVKSLLQHRSSKAPILHCSAFFIVQLSHPYMTLCSLILITVGLIPEMQQQALQSPPRTGRPTPAPHRVGRGHACPVFRCPALDRNAVLLKADER